MAYREVAFEDAIGIFEGPTFERADESFDYGEARVYAIGIADGVEITVIYTDVSDTERGLFRHGRRNGMKEKHTGGTLSKGRTDWERLRSRSDRQVRHGIEMDPDARPTRSSGRRRMLSSRKQNKPLRYD